MIVIVDPDPGFRSKTTAELGRPGVQELAGLVNLAAAGLSPGSVVVLGPHLEPADQLRAAHDMQTTAPGVSVVLVAESLTPEVLQRAMRAGVKDVVPLGAPAGALRDAVNRAEALSRQAQGGPQGPDAAARPHCLVTVFSTKGGCGKSVVASNLAILLADRTGEGVALVDLDLESGDLAIMLGLLPAWTIYDAAEHLERLDEETLRAYLTPHPSGVALLAAPLDPALAATVSPEAVRRILRTMMAIFPYIIVDGPAAFTDQVLAALDESDVCILVGSMDVPSIKNLKLGLSTLAKLGIPRERIKVVLNRADSKVGLNVGEVEKTLGSRIDVAIPSTRDVPLSVNQGSPLATQGRRSAVVNAIAELLAAIKLPGDPRQEEGRRAKRARG